MYTDLKCNQVITSKQFDDLVASFKVLPTLEWLPNKQSRTESNTYTSFNSKIEYESIKEDGNIKKFQQRYEGP